MSTEKPLKLSIRRVGVTTQDDAENHNFVDKIIKQLPKGDVKAICAIIMDYDSGDVGRVTRDALPSPVWNEIGASKAKKILTECQEEGRRETLTFNPIWEKGEKLSSYDVLHEVGHVVYDNLPVGATPERQFWIDRANIEDISHKGVVANLKAGRGSLTHEYFADHYARCHLGDQTIPKQERDKLHCT